MYLKALKDSIWRRPPHPLPPKRNGWDPINSFNPTLFFSMFKPGLGFPTFVWWSFCVQWIQGLRLLFEFLILFYHRFRFIICLQLERSCNIVVIDFVMQLKKQFQVSLKEKKILSIHMTLCCFCEHSIATLSEKSFNSPIQL